MTTAIADGIGKEFAGAIKEADLGAVGTEVAHGALGCVTGMIRSQSGSGCAAGAAGAVVGHVSAPLFEAAGLTVYGYSADQTTSFFSSTLGGAVAAAVGKDDKVQSNFGVGQAAGANAVDNNYLTFKPKDTANSQLNQFANELDACKKTTGCNQDDVYAKWTKIRNDQQAGQVATSDGVFNALSPTAMAAGGKELGSSILASTVNPADVCREGDARCYSFVTANNKQAMAVTTNVIVGVGAMDLGGTVRPSAPVSKPVSPNVEPNTIATGRPTPRASEIDVGAELPAGARAQISYKNGQEVPYGTPGSVRPDFCIGNTCSVEVKNYNITTNSSGLINNVSGQAIQRAENLPAGMTQTVTIDIRGQSVTPAQRANIVQGIVSKSNGAISRDSILFKDK